MTICDILKNDRNTDTRFQVAKVIFSSNRFGVCLVQGLGSSLDLPQAFHPSSDEIIRRLSSVEIVLDGAQLNDESMSVAESMPDHAKVQALMLIPQGVESKNYL